MADNLVESWSTPPYTDIVVVDASGWVSDCPASHPEDVIYQIWPGTRYMCDCLERKQKREYYLDIVCDKKGKHPEHNSPDCFDVPGHSPIVQNRINEVKICGKRGPDSLALKNVQGARKADDGTYRCPEGTKPCNPSFLDSADLVQYAICMSESSDLEQDCPITAMAFTLEGMEQS